MTTFEDAHCQPDGCTLPAAERPLRGAEFSTLFAASLRSFARVDDTRLTLSLTGAAGLRHAVEDLTARETACCSFFTFTITDVDDGIRLDVAVPPAYVHMLDGLARHAATAAGLAA